MPLELVSQPHHTTPILFCTSSASSTFTVTLQKKIICQAIANVLSLSLSLQAEPPSSTHSATRMCSRIRMPTIPPMLTLRMVSRSSLSPLVRYCQSISQYKRPEYDISDWSLPGIELELDEEGTRISLTIVDTPGFGDQIDNEAR